MGARTEGFTDTSGSPTMADVPIERMLQPIDYPEPIVDLKESYKRARDTLWKLKSDPMVGRERERILNQHVERRYQKRFEEKEAS